MAALDQIKVIAENRLTNTMDRPSNKLITRKPKRLFTFGCSFSNYNWGGMWPEIVAYDLNIPYYNYGLCGCGNQYMACMLMQADIFYKFNSDDLIIVQWTNVCREDRYAWGVWQTSGNIFGSNLYNDKYKKQWADPEGYLLRDLTSIQFVDTFLASKECQYHFLSMVNVACRPDQYSDDTKIFDNITSIFSDTLSKIHKSFYEVLWNDKISIKENRDIQLIGKKFFDGHPHPAETLEYLQKTFTEHLFDARTIQSVGEIHQKWIDEMKKYHTTYHFKQRDWLFQHRHKIRQATTILPAQKVQGIISHLD